MNRMTIVVDVEGDLNVDMIERQAAIDTLDGGAEFLRRVLDVTDLVGAERTKYEWGLGLIESYIDDIKELPTAQPEPCEDAISRQAARHALCKAVHKGEDIPCENQTTSCLWTGTRVCDFEREIDALPSVQPEPSIPLSWIEKHIEWHKSLDNVFAELVAAHISAMLKKWRDEQGESN